MKKTKDNKIMILLIIVLVLLMSISIYLGTRASLLYENITYVGNIDKYHPLFIIWGIFNSLYCMCLYLMILPHLPYMKIPVKQSCIILFFLSIISFLSPYTQHSNDIFSRIHEYGSIISTVGTFSLIIYTIIAAQMYYPEYFTSLKNSTIALLFFASMLMLTLGDISSLMELVLLNGLNIILLYMFHQIQKMSITSQ